MLSLSAALVAMEDDIVHSNAATAATLCVLFFSTLTRSTLGFGDALIAMPFLAMLLGMQTAAPLVALISLMILVRNWHIVDFHMTWRLIMAAAGGVPVGLFYLTRVPEPMTQMLLGCLLIGFCLYNLRRSPNSQMRVSLHAAYAFGFAAGTLGGAYNIAPHCRVAFFRHTAALSSAIAWPVSLPLTLCNILFCLCR